MQVDRGVFCLFVFGAKVGKILFKYNVKPTLPYYNILNIDGVTPFD